MKLLIMPKYLWGIIPFHYNSVTDCFETDTELIFSGCFDLTYVSVYTDDGNEKVFYSEFLRIATTKQTAMQIEKKLGEIEESIPNFLEVCIRKFRERGKTV